MTRYAIIKEKAEISRSDFERSDGDIFGAVSAKGMQNGSFNTLGTVETREQALDILAEYQTTLRLVDGLNNKPFFESDLFYIEEQKYDEENEEWNATGNYDAAEQGKIENPFDYTLTAFEKQFAELDDKELDLTEQKNRGL